MFPSLYAASVVVKRETKGVYKMSPTGGLPLEITERGEKEKSCFFTAANTRHFNLTLMQPQSHVFVARF